MPPVITYPIASQKQFDRAVDKYNTTHPEPAPVLPDTLAYVTTTSYTLSDTTKRIFLFDSGGTQNITFNSAMNALPNGTEIQLIKMNDNGTLNLSGGAGVSLAAIGDNGDATGKVQRFTLIKFGPAAWLLYTFIPYTAP